MKSAMLVTVLLVPLACARARDAPVAPVPVAQPAAPAGPPAAPPTPSSPDDLVAETPESNPNSETVTIKLVSEQARKAHVFWGRKDLGLAPLELQRPRGSGPLDLVVVTPGALTLHTRVFTDRDDKLALRFYAVADAPTMLGYRADDDPALKPPKNPEENAKRKVRAHAP
ncbi:MAG TPA: hypothetical protein VH560_09235 [Polyangia bacterium]|nr:hypothetical protein [Polyangia bacterium]